MKTYFLAIQASPLPENPLIEKIENAYVYFWIVDATPEGALKRASEHLSKYLWEQGPVDTGPMEVTATDFANQQDGLMGFWKAKQKGFAAQFVGKPKWGQTGERGPESQQGPIR